MAIIGLVGYAKSGKDTVAKMIQVHTSPVEFPNWMDIEEKMTYVPDSGKKVRWEIKKFGGKLKEIASILTGIPVSSWEEQDFKESRLQAYGMTAREFLQKLGTEAIRNNLHDNAWVTALMSEYKPITTMNMIESKWIITDVRFPNEAKAIKSRGGVVVRINRPDIKPVNSHLSETSMDNWEYVHVINNNGTINELYDKSVALFESLKK